jgi:uncharacterized protein
MRWAVIFEDAPEMLAIRKEREAQHLAYLQQHEDEILIAGGLRDEPGGAFVGGLWVMEVGSKERAVQLIEADPYFAPNCRSYKLRMWGKALADKRVVL